MRYVPVPSYLAAGVCACAAEVEIGYGCAVMRPTGERTLGEELARNDIEVTDVSVGETDPPFQVNGCKQRPVNDNIAEIRRVGGERIDKIFTDLLPTLIPCSLPQMDRGVEHPDRHDMVPRRCHRWVVDGRNLYLHHRRP